jgi:anthranilate phosphoribosyltransferase
VELCIRINLDEFEPMDVCGTGGDGKNTFNISTTAAFVVAGAGVKVAKHGNYGVSSSSGSSNVIEHVGYVFSSQEDQLKKEIDRAGITFLHAPLFHPAMKAVAPVRKQLGMKTVFNMLGPLVNPAHIRTRMAGVWSLQVARLYRDVLADSNERWMIVRGLDGYDEISLTGECLTVLNDKEIILTAESFGYTPLTHRELAGGTPEHNARIMINVLQGTATPAQMQVSIANASAALVCAGRAKTFLEGKELAEESIHSGNAYSSFLNLLETSR